jgi:hypothetical protein
MVRNFTFLAEVDCFYVLEVVFPASSSVWSNSCAVHTLYAVGKDHVIEWHIWMMTSEGTILIHYRSVQIQKAIIHKYCHCRGVIGRNATGTLGRVEPQRLGKSSPRRLSPAPYQEQQPLPAEQNDQPVRVSTSYNA